MLRSCSSYYHFILSTVSGFSPPKSPVAPAAETKNIAFFSQGHVWFLVKVEESNGKELLKLETCNSKDNETIDRQFKNTKKIAGYWNNLGGED